MLDLYWIWGGGALALLLIIILWRPLLAITVHEELSSGRRGIPVFTVRLLFMLLIAVIIALAMKVVGILLITSLLIIPAATARRFASTPEGMAILASLLGCVAVGLRFGCFTCTGIHRLGHRL